MGSEAFIVFLRHVTIVSDVCAASHVNVSDTQQHIWCTYVRRREVDRDLFVSVGYTISPVTGRTETQTPSFCVSQFLDVLSEFFQMRCINNFIDLRMETKHKC